MKSSSLMIKFWNKNLLLMEALLCANSMVFIKQSHIWGISWNIYTLYIHLYMDTPTEYSQIYWPLYQQKIKLIEKESRNRKKLHSGHLQKCGYIILNIRSMCWIIALRKKCFHLYESICFIEVKPNREPGFRTVKPTRLLKVVQELLK